MKIEQLEKNGYTHFIEVWKAKGENEVERFTTNLPIDYLPAALEKTKEFPYIYTVCIFLIKPKSIF